MEEIYKTPEDSYTEQVHIVFSEDINGNGRLFGGKLVAWMDVVAAVVGRRHSGCEVTTASIDKTSFAAPARLNDLMIITGKLVEVGNTSMKVEVTAYVENKCRRSLINKALFVVVALDENDRPTRVPRLRIPEGGFEPVTTKACPVRKG
jgi:acyl-CoA hydrolase